MQFSLTALGEHVPGSAEVVLEVHGGPTPIILSFVTHLYVLSLDG